MTCQKLICPTLATCPDPQYRNAPLAVQLARAALHPDDQPMWRLLGIAEYRAENYGEAITALEESTQRREGGDAIDWLFLAMAYAQIGERETAHRWYRQASAALDNQEPICLDVVWHPAQLEGFRQEAASLIDSALGAKPPT